MVFPLLLELARCYRATAQSEATNMVLELGIGIGIGIGIGFLTVELESDESARIGRIGSVTRVFLAEACFVAKK